ncbi:MAG TPA: GNAT family N-acetyltransferase [Kofleriaceae bacterium]|jgi:ribosomal protein S18 acetylase RimI-like enzyme
MSSRVAAGESSKMIRPANLGDVPLLVAFSSALNAHESIAVSDAVLEAGLRQLIGDPKLGVVFLIEDAGSTVGYALCAFAFDLEFGGREAWLTELFIGDDARGHGLGTAALQDIQRELRARGLKALHLQVRAENPAVALYERLGFSRVPRLVMSRRL